LKSGDSTECVGQERTLSRDVSALTPSLGGNRCRGVFGKPPPVPARTALETATKEIQHMSKRGQRDPLSTVKPGSGEVDECENRCEFVGGHSLINGPQFCHSKMASTGQRRYTRRIFRLINGGSDLEKSPARNQATCNYRKTSGLVENRPITSSRNCSH